MKPLDWPCSESASERGYRELTALYTAAWEEAYKNRMFLPSRGTGGEGAYGVCENKAEVRYCVILMFLTNYSCLPPFLWMSDLGACSCFHYSIDHSTTHWLIMMRLGLKNKRYTVRTEFHSLHSSQMLTALATQFAALRARILKVRFFMSFIIYSLSFLWNAFFTFPQ